MVSFLHLVLVFFKEARPVGLVLFRRVFEVCEDREDFADGNESRLDDKVDEPELALRDVCCLTVVELAHWEAMDLL